MNIPAIALAVLLLSGGSDAATPYTVDPSGITLPAGQTFPDNGHVNIRTSTGNVNLHFESKCITRTDAECAGARHDAAQFIGKSFIPWSAFGLTDCDTVSWVQIAQFNEHYGEGGQPVVTVGTCTPPTSPPTEEPPTEEPPVEEPPVEEPPAEEPPAEEPPSETPTPIPSEPESLADTGVETWTGVGAALALLAAGGLILARRRKV